MIIIFVKSLTFPWLKQKVACYHFKDHTCERPHICRWTIIYTDYCFRRPILTSLNLARKMMVVPSSITQITNFYLNVLINFLTSFKFQLRSVCFRLFGFIFLIFISLSSWFRNCLLLSVLFPFFLQFFI